MRLGVVLVASLLPLSAVNAARTGQVGRSSERAPERIPVKITSPLGRTGTPGTVRIVARVDLAAEVLLKPVRFLVDGVLLQEDVDGPPYAVEWLDANPFDRHELAVEVEDASGRTGRDAIVLEPFEVTDQTEVFSVLIEATVRDKKGQFITGLSPSQFVLSEDGSAQTPDLARLEAVPATFALMVDSSQSMARRFDFVRAAAARLAAYMRPLDRLIVAPFSKQVSAFTGPTNDRATVDEAIVAIKAGGGTAIFDSLKEVAERISRIEGRRDIILITDGFDEHSEATFDDAIEAVRRATATVYVVGIGGTAGISLKGREQLRELAEQTGGRAFFPPELRDLRLAYDQLAVDAQNRYVLTYTPTNQRQNGGWRSIALATHSPEHVVITREGYYSPEAPPIRANIEFAVVDESWRYVDVAIEDLIVREDGVDQKVDTFTEAVEPIQIVLTLDQSGSMRRAAPAVKAAAADFVRALRPQDPLALITFSDKPRFAHDLATVREWSIDAIEKYQTIGGTALYDALYDSLMRLNALKGRRAVVILTDGRDENDPGTGPGSVHTLAQVIQRAEQVDAQIFAIGMGPNVDRDVLERLAEISGGRAYFPQDTSRLADDYTSILENLRRRYVLGYASTNRERDGAWRNVEIRLRMPGLSAKSRGGYFAPER